MPPRPSKDAAQWLHKHACPSESAKGRSVMAVPKSGWVRAGGRLELHSDTRAVLLQWVECMMNCRLSADVALGFGLIAAKEFIRGDTVIKGTPDRSIDDACCAIEGGGVLLGPASLVNRACSRHSNIKFTKGSASNAQWLAVACRSIKPGQAVLANYKVGPDKLDCPRC